MTYQEKLIRFYEKKNDWLKALTDIDYMYEEDFEYIKNIPESDCESLYNDLRNNILKGYCSLTGYTCIFCIINNSRCSICFYKKEHEECDRLSSNNTYGQILNVLSSYYKKTYCSNGLYKLWLEEIEKGE